MDFEALCKLFEDVGNNLPKLYERGVGQEIGYIRSLITEIPKIVEAVLRDHIPPPLPDPKALSQDADRIRGAADELVTMEEELAACRTHVAHEHWDATSGDNARRTYAAANERTRTIQPFNRAVAAAYDHYAEQMTDIRARHERLKAELTHNSSLWTILGKAPLSFDPDDWAGFLLRSVQEIGLNVAAYFTTYKDAHQACADAQNVIGQAQAQLRMPAALPPGMAALAGLNATTAPLDDPDAPPVLKPGVAEHAKTRLDQMNEADRKHVEDLLGKAKSPDEQAWILAEVAAGGDPSTLDHFADRIRGKSADDLRNMLDPDYFARHNPAITSGGQIIYTDKTPAGQLRQPDGTSCNGSAVTMSRMRNDPAYAMRVLNGYDPKIDETVTAPKSTNSYVVDGVLENDSAARDRFGAEAKAAQARMDEGHLIPEPQLPWPEGLGAPPGNVANELNHGAGAPGAHYQSSLTNPSPQALAEEYQHVVTAARQGQESVILVGSEIRPSHYVTVTSVNTDGSLNVYDPGYGKVVTVSRDDFAHGKLDKLGGPGFGTAWGTVRPQ